MKFATLESAFHRLQPPGCSHRLTRWIAFLETLSLFILADTAVIALAAGVAGGGQVFAFVTASILIAVMMLLTAYLMETLRPGAKTLSGGRKIGPAGSNRVL